VIKDHFRQQNTDLWEPENLVSDSSKSILKGLTIENAQICRQEFDDFLKSSEHCQKLTTGLTPAYRKLKAKLTSLETEAETRLRECSEFVEDSSDDDDEINLLEKLRKKCQLLTVQGSNLKQEFEAEKCKLVQNLDIIESVVGQKAKHYILDLDFAACKSDENLSTIMEKLLNSVQDLQIIPSPKQTFPLQEIQNSLQNVEKHGQKFNSVQPDELLNDLKVRNSHLEGQLKVINWREAFKNKNDEVLMPPTPGIKIQTDVIPLLGTASKFLLENKQQQQQQQSTLDQQQHGQTSSDMSGVSVKQSTPTASKMASVSSPEQSRILTYDSQLYRSRQDETPKSTRCELKLNNFETPFLAILGAVNRHFLNK
jgi:hypothetical protein